MAAHISQITAKQMVRDYLRETGRKGATSLMRDINRHVGTHEAFAQRTLEKWLSDDDRRLHDSTWALVLSFIESEAFKRVVPYANEGSAEQRLIQVADGFVALYGHSKQSGRLIALSSKVNADGVQAIQLLAGTWKSDERMMPTQCKIEPVPGKPYAKFASVCHMPWSRLTTAGIVIYLYSMEREAHDYLHMFILQVWRRRDPETGSTMPGDLRRKIGLFTSPELAISADINSHFYKSEGEESDKRVVFKYEAGPRKEPIIDILLEDVLPHGYRET